MSTNKKKMRLMLGICVPAASLAVAGGVTALVLALNNNKPTDDVYGEGDYTVRFNAGEGKITNGYKAVRVKAGSKLDQVRQPEVAAQGKKFAGWKDEQGNPFNSLKRINADTVLTANYANDNDTSYINVYFNMGGYPGSIHGNPYVRVLKGTNYFMINRPAATSTGYVFKGWSLTAPTFPDTERPLVPESTIFNEEKTLYPVFAHAIQVEYLSEGTKVSSSNIVEVTQGTKFCEINPPEFNNGTKYIEGWYKDAARQTRWLPTDTISSNTKAYAKWIDDISTGYITLNFIATGHIDGSETVQTVTYGSSYTNPAMKKDAATTWATVNKPIAQIQGHAGEYNVVYWEYSTDQSTWTKATDAMTAETMAGASTTLYIRPVFELVTGDVYLYSTDAQVTGTPTTGFSFVSLPGKEYNLNAYMDAACPQTFEWTLTADAAGTTVSDWASIDTETTGATNKLTIKSDIKPDQTTPITFTITAKSKVNESKSQKMTFTLKQPWVGDGSYWLYDNDTSDAKKGWWLIKAGDLTSDAETITITRLDGTTTRTLRKRGTVGSSESKFESQEIYIGSEVTAIENNFLKNCSYFNGKIILPTTTDAKQITSIGDNFMAGCSAFNQAIFGDDDNNLLKNVKTIGDGFMANCTSFNNGIDGTEVTSSPFYFAKTTATPAITTIGEDFLFGCTNFNTPIYFELAANLKTIGNGLMYKCSSFSKNISFANGKLTDIGDHFMYGCDNFGQLDDGETGPRTIAVGATNKFHEATHAIMSTSSTAKINTVGFAVTGDTTVANKFCADFPTMADATESIYRKNLSTTEIACTIPATPVTTDSTFSFPVTVTKGGTAVTDWTVTSLVSTDLATVAKDGNNVKVTTKDQAFKLGFMITANGRDVLFTVQVVNKTLENLTQATPATTLEYSIGAGTAFSKAGLTATATYNSTQTETITADNLVTDYDNHGAFVEGEEGTKTVTVSYTYAGITKTFTYEITVTA